MYKSIAVFVCFGAAASFAQDNPLSGAMKMMYGMGKGNILKSAEKAPESMYSYKPTDEVRSFGQLIGHVADAQYLFCSAVLGVPNPSPNVEKTVTSKDALVKALNDAFTFCDKAYDSMTDATAAEKVKFFGRESPKLAILSFNNMHDYEHYGNIVTYLRLKNIVPPSSEQQGAPAAKKK